MKKRMLLFLIFVLGTVYTQAQEVNTTTYKQFTIYTEANTGTLVGNTDGLFSGNEFNFGIMYRQNFVKAPWLAVYTKISAISTLGFNTINLNKDPVDGNVFPENIYNGYRKHTIEFDYVEIGVSTDYGYISLRDNLLLKMYGYYPIALGNNHSLQIIFGTELTPLQKGELKNNSNPELDGKKSGPLVDLITVGMIYTVDLSPEWKYSVGFHYRTGGQPFEPGNNLGVSLIDPDSKDAFKHNSHFRFENTISYTHQNGIGLFTTLRYQPSRFGSGFPEGNWRDLRIKHDVYLKFGLSYTVDFNNLNSINN